jgi:hypothetical protein
MASDKVVLIGYLGAWLGALVLTAVAFWRTRTLASRARIRALVIVASFAPSFIILKFNGVVSTPHSWCGHRRYLCTPYWSGLSSLRLSGPH